MLLQDYQKYKSEYPDAIIWMILNNYVHSFSDCAILTAKTLKTPLLNKTKDKYCFTGFPKTELHENLTKMIVLNHRIVFITY